MHSELAFLCCRPDGRWSPLGMNHPARGLTLKSMPGVLRGDFSAEGGQGGACLSGEAVERD
jgi:hypothetical protein